MAKKEKLQDIFVNEHAAKSVVEPAKADDAQVHEQVDIDNDDFTVQLIKDINKECGSRVAYNLAEMTAPTIIKRWIDTGSIQLNYAIRNMFGGGYPEGRIIEISGLPSCGKSHLAYHASAVVQALGGLVVYIDSETATPLDKLRSMGIDVRKRFVYVDCHVVEEVFKVIESVILKAKKLPVTKNVPILVIWDSVAAASPLEEINGDYDDNTMGLKARVIGKCMRKVVDVIGRNNVTLLCINQLREAIGVMHGDKFITPGGKSIPFHASLRIRLTSGTPIKDKNGNIIGIHVIATIKKNKVGVPFKKCEFDIVFGKGIDESDYLFDVLRAYCKKNKVTHDGKDIRISGDGGWKELVVSDATTGEVVVEKKFYKSEFASMMRNVDYMQYIMRVVDKALVVDIENSEKSEEGDDTSNDDDEVCSD